MVKDKDGYQSTEESLGRAIAVAEYYGFRSLDSIARIKGRSSTDSLAMSPSTVAPTKVENDIAFARRDERTLPSAARKLLDRMPSPRDTVLAWRTSGNASAGTPASLELHVVGTNSAIADALLIVVGHAIARECSGTDGVVLINSIGSPESNSRFARDVGVYLRKHLESISPTLRPRAATDPVGTLVQLVERGHPAIARAPQAMEYLNEDERARFWELLEYLEAAGLPYELNNHVLGSRDCWSHTLFEIAQTDPLSSETRTLAFGGRYDPLISRCARAPRAGAMVVITYGGDVRPVRPPATPPTAVLPAIYFAHLGPIARQHSLGILENLRRASIPVHQGLWRERITDQMLEASTLGVPYILIFGHKEATEHTIIVREVATNSQSSIPLEDLVPYLKRHRIVGRVPAGV